MKPKPKSALYIAYCVLYDGDREWCSVLFLLCERGAANMVASRFFVKIQMLLLSV